MTFFKEHIIQDPKKTFVDYSVFSSCKEVPVALDTPKGGWSKTQNFPTMGTLKYISALQNMPKAFRENPIARTVSEYKLGNVSLYILPSLDFIAETGWQFFVTPEIRKHMAGQIRKYKTLNILAQKVKK